MGHGKLAVRWLAGFGLLGLFGACELMDRTVFPVLSGEPMATAHDTAAPAGTAKATLESAGGAALVGQRPPLVLIRFDTTQAGFERPLRSAVDDALAHRPEAVFDLVAIEPAGAGPGQAALSGEALRRDLAQVFQALVRAGVPAERISLSATTQPTIAVREVHVYAR